MTEEEKLERRRAYQRKYLKTDKGKISARKARRVWRNTPEGHAYLYQDRKNYYARTQHLTNGKRRWTCEEDELVLNFGDLDEKLAYKIGRSVAAIQTRRYKLLKEED